MMSPGARTSTSSTLRDFGRVSISYLISDRVSNSTIVVTTVVKNPETLDMLRTMLPPAQVVLKRDYDPPRLAELVETCSPQREALSPMHIEPWRLYLTVSIPFMGLLIKWFAVSLRRALATAGVGGRTYTGVRIRKTLQNDRLGFSERFDGVLCVALVVRTSPLQ